MVSLTEHDGFAVTGSAALTAFADALGLQVVEFRAATESDIDSAWARRLGIPRRRSAWVLVAEKP
jgi:hypothetical protein